MDYQLDNFISLGPPRTLVCQSNLERMLSLCARLGVPVVPAKCGGPALVLVFLGFKLDTATGETATNTGPSSMEMGGQKRMQEKGAGISLRSFTACGHSNPPRPHICTSLDKAAYRDPA